VSFSSSSRVVVVGASLAGLRACETLRTAGFAGEVVVVGEEPTAFYDRPPLSKRYLAGEWDRDRISLRKPEALAGLGLTLRTGVRAVSLVAAERTVVLDNGETLAADGIVIATGSTPRRLALGGPVGGVHVVRTVDDADGLRPRLIAGARVVVIGAGFIGLEVAATARANGAEVTVLEGAPVPLARSLGPEVGAAIADVHRRHGVVVRCGATVERLLGDTEPTGVVVDGETLPADVVVVGVGAAPATEWLDGSGLEIRDGIVCDETLRAADSIYAAGDVARWPHPLYADVEPDIRVEHWTNAAEQGALAARNLLAESENTGREPHASVPFFWSDQFDARLQFLGRAVPGSTAEVVAGSLESGVFCAAWFRGEVLRGVLGVSMPKLVMPARALLEQRVSADRAREHFRAAGA